MLGALIFDLKKLWFVPFWQKLRRLLLTAFSFSLLVKGSPSCSRKKNSRRSSSEASSISSYSISKSSKASRGAGFSDA